jgi:hypothetical protein
MLLIARKQVLTPSVEHTIRTKGVEGRRTRNCNIDSYSVRTKALPKKQQRRSEDKSGMAYLVHKVLARSTVHTNRGASVR